MLRGTRHSPLAKTQPGTAWQIDMTVSLVSLSLFPRRLLAGRDKERGEGSKLGTPCTVEELKTFAELRAVRGFYPRVHLVAPDTLALMQAAVASTAVGSSSTPLDVLLDNMKAGRHLNFPGISGTGVKTFLFTVC